MVVWTVGCLVVVVLVFVVFSGVEEEFTVDCVAVVAVLEVLVVGTSGDGVTELVEDTGDGVVVFVEETVGCTVLVVVVAVVVVECIVVSVDAVELGCVASSLVYDVTEGEVWGTIVVV